MNCHRCSTENPDSSTYCDHCGSMLRDIAPIISTNASFTSNNCSASSVQQSYESPSNFLDYASSPQILDFPKILKESKLSRFFRIILYAIGILFAATGLFGAFTPPGTGDRVLNIALFFTFAFITISVVVAVRTHKRISRLRWPMRLWWIGGDIAGFFMAATLVMAIGKLTDPFPNYLFGIAFMLFGLILAGVAWW